MLQPHAINLLKRLGERVVERHHEYDQSAWGEGIHKCHTSCCFGGHLCLMVDGIIPEGIGLCEPAKNPVFVRAKEILDISTAKAIELFSDFDPNFGWRFAGLGWVPKGSLEYARRAQKFLNEWIEKETRP